jgi:hypothetical protein
MSERIGIHVVSGEWSEADVDKPWETTKRIVGEAYRSGDPLEFGDELFNPYTIISVRRGGVPVDAGDTV